ncbi:hypothetical protein SHKM778_76300 [Streptomyces sp. KM77-8]|uniref:AMP-dependent synthetase/ligase domain-containing protein n=1 Tax=Streptomyces haneummycinicus TaxID=3074435 RepID=A0AAT9HVE2_9ACTN
MAGEGRAPVGAGPGRDEYLAAWQARRMVKEYDACPLFPALTDGPAADRPALRFGERSLTYGELAPAAGAVAGELKGCAGSPSGPHRRWRRRSRSRRRWSPG